MADTMSPDSERRKRIARERYEQGIADLVAEAPPFSPRQIQVLRAAFWEGEPSVAARREPASPPSGQGSTTAEGIDHVAQDVFIDSVELSRPITGGGSALREFAGSIEQSRNDKATDVGLVSGLIGWHIEHENLGEVAQPELGAAAQEMRTSLVNLGVEVDSCLIVDALWISEGALQENLAKAIVDQLMDLFRLDPTSTLVLLASEAEVGVVDPMLGGNLQHKASLPLGPVYEASGYSRWRSSRAWWRPRQLVDASPLFH